MVESGVLESCFFVAAGDCMRESRAIFPLQCLLSHAGVTVTGWTTSCARQEKEVRSPSAAAVLFRPKQPSPLPIVVRE
jgi:hypothetical protein